VVAYVFAPLFFGVVFGWLRVSRTYDWSFASALAYWILAVQLCWLIQGAATWLVQKLLRPWTPPLVVLLMLGTLAGTPFVDIAMRALVETYQALVVPEAYHMPLKPPSIETYFQAHFIGSFIWIVTNLAIVHALRLNRFGFQPEEPPQPAPPATPPPPEFAQRHKRPVGPLLVLKAEQHYLRVIGRYGEGLVLYRFSDAVREAQEHIDGLQVHRSFWVARAAVSHTERGDRGLGLRLRDGTLIPVSRSCRPSVLKAGFPAERPPVDISWRASDTVDAADRGTRANPVV
jgi:hypothetical protein